MSSNAPLWYWCPCASLALGLRQMSFFRFLMPLLRAPSRQHRCQQCLRAECLALCKNVSCLSDVTISRNSTRPVFYRSTTSKHAFSVYPTTLRTQRTYVAEWYCNSDNSIAILSGQPRDGQHSFGVSGCHAGLMWVHCRHPLSLDAEPPRKCSNAIFSTVINSEIGTQTDAAGSPALPANRRALFTYTDRSPVHTDDTCSHDTRHTHEYDTRALALRGFGPGPPALLGTVHR